MNHFNYFYQRPFWESIHGFLKSALFFVLVVPRNRAHLIKK